MFLSDEDNSECLFVFSQIRLNTECFLVSQSDKAKSVVHCFSQIRLKTEFCIVFSADKAKKIDVVLGVFIGKSVMLKETKILHTGYVNTFVIWGIRTCFKIVYNSMSQYLSFNGFQNVDNRLNKFK